jgi:hypothetical protein
MEIINIHTAKTQLSKLIAEGKEVIIARYGQPVLDTQAWLWWSHDPSRITRGTG